VVPTAAEHGETDARYELRRFAAEFVDPDIEAVYWIDASTEASGWIRRAAVISILGVLVFAVVDAWNLGVGARWWGLLVIRVGYGVGALAFASAVRRDPQLVRRHELVCAMQVAIFGCYQAVALLQPDIGGIEQPSIGLIAVGIFVLVPNRLRYLTATSAAGVAIWMVLSSLQSKPSLGVVLVQSMQFSFVLIVGFLAANRIALSSRRAFAQRLKEVEVSERLAVEIAWRQRMESELITRANVDHLTRLSNRRHFYELADLEFRRAQRTNQSVTFLVIDVDHFKLVNDTHGHAAGDEVLSSLGADLSAAVRRVDVVGRVGGEEFAVLMPGASVAKGAEVAERIRVKISSTVYRFGTGSVMPTVSIGVAEGDPWVERAEEVLARADLALYRAKNDGRDRVESAPTEPLTLEQRVALEKLHLQGLGDSWTRHGDR